MSENQKSVDELNPPEEFYKIIDDFIVDILITFPEYSGIISRWWNNSNNNNPTDNNVTYNNVTDNNITENKTKKTVFIFRHCVKVFPERFFDILYKNVEIFNEESDVNTEFLPGIVFKQLWKIDISDKTKDTIWKYLQLILFSVIGSVHNTCDLGDTAKLFEAINEEELKKKLEETLEGMQNLFDASGCSMDASFSNINMPNADQLHDHINSMMGGKLGKLALELAEETAKDLNLDMDNNGDTKDVFQKLFKNPGKMMNMVKNIGNKIDEKIKSGEIKESELMEEGMDLLNKMKNMPGMGDMQKMFSQMGIPGLGKGAKINMGAMESQLNKNMKTAKMRERLKTKAETKAKEKSNTGFCNMSDLQPKLSDEELLKIFSTGEKVERTPRGTAPPEIQQSSKKAKKKTKK